MSKLEELLQDTGYWGHHNCGIEGDPADGFGRCTCGLEDQVIKPIKALFLEMIGEDELIEITDPESIYFGEKVPNTLVERSELRQKVSEL